MEDLAEKLILQERRIGELERKCNISNDVLSEEYKNKSASAENFENYYDAKRMDSKISTSWYKFLQLEQLRGAVDSGKEKFSFFLNI